ncbi:MAG: tetratricopeptide repeat protein [Verrucomicrobia bacterium]|nr:tetratricopeptide repeat protein [Verrucomicrobiota bacterium]
MREAAIFVLVLFFTLSLPASEESVRMSIAIYRDDHLQAALTDLVAAALSQDERWEIVDRSNLDLVFQEWSNNAFIKDPAKQARLGKLLQVDYFVWLSMANEASEAVLEIVDARSGTIVLTKRLTIPRRDVGFIVKLVTAEMHASTKGQSAIVSSNMDGVAFAKPLIEFQSEELQTKLNAALSGLMSDLADLKVPLLHRKYVENVIGENLWREKGFIQKEQDLVTFEGAKYLVASKFDEADGAMLLSLIIVDASTGKRLSQNTFSLRKTATNYSIDKAAAKWIQDSTASATTMPVQTRVVKPSAERLQPETLKSFYQGILLQNQGCCFEAVDSFAAAYRSDIHFLEALRWTQSCYEVGGFAEISASLDRFIAKSEHWRGMANPKHIHADPGVNFLGLSVAEKSLETIRIPLSLLLVDCIHETTQATVFLTEDLAPLAKEYDLLVGLEQHRGTTWQTAPPLLFEDTLTGNLTRDRDGLSLELRVIHRLDPKKQNAATLLLPVDRGKWKEAIQHGTKKLYAEPEPPQSLHPLIRESEAELIKLSRKSLRDEQILKLFFLTPRHPELLFHFPARGKWDNALARQLHIGLHKWLARAMPSDDPRQPWVELTAVFEATTPNWCGTGYYGPQPSECFEEQRKLSVKHENHPAGWIARYNTLLYDLTENNYDATRREIEKIIVALEKRPSSEIPPSVLSAMKGMGAALSLALGLPLSDPRDARVMGYVLARQPLEASCEFFIQSLLPGFMVNANSNVTRKFDQQDVMIDLTLYPHIFRNHLPIPVVQGLLKKYSTNDRVLEYAITCFGQISAKIPSVKDQELIEFTSFCEQYTEVVCDILKQEHVSYDSEHLSVLISCVTQWNLLCTRNEAAKQRIVKCRDNIQKCVLAAIQNKAINLPDDLAWRRLIWSLGVAQSDFDPTIEKALLERAKNAWQVEPLADKSWFLYAEWKSRFISKEDRALIYLPHVARLREIYDAAPKTEEIAWLYSQFALTLFQAGHYDVAEELYEQITSWRGDGKNSRWRECKANAFYLLALLRQRNGDMRSALNLAQRALDEIQDERFHLLNFVVIGGGGYRGEALLKSIVTDYIAALRLDPKAPFKDPFK